MDHTWQIVDVTERADDDRVVWLIATGNDAEHPERALEPARRAVREYQDGGAFSLWGAEAQGKIVGVIGIERRAAGEAVLRDLAVAPEARRRGVGTALVEFAKRETSLRVLHGYARANPIEFYRRCGFTVREEGLLRSGEPRYLFEWRA